MNAADRKLRVFLCHASQDKPVVRELYQRLLAEGWIDPWLDVKKLLPGQDWRSSIEDAVESSDVVIICLSSRSVNKEGFVQKEMRYAKEIALEKPEDTIFLIPVLFEECDVPRGLRFLQWTKYFGNEKEKGFQDLLESLKIREEQITLRLAEELAARQAEEEARVENELSGRQKIDQMGSVPLSEMEIASRTKNFDWLRVSGRVNSTTAPEFSRKLESIIDAGRYNILVDMTDLEYMSSAGFRALLAAQRTCRRYNRGRVVLKSPSRRIQDAMELAGFSNQFVMLEDPFEAF